MPKDAKDVAAGLSKKGFVPRDSHHTFFHLYVDGKKRAVYTKISHGNREIDDKLLAMMARQVGLAKRDFYDLIECPLSFDDYVKLLRAESRIDP